MYSILQKFLSFAEGIFIFCQELGDFFDPIYYIYYIIISIFICFQLDSPGESICLTVRPSVANLTSLSVIHIAILMKLGTHCK